jgi:hypothetical protein
MGVCHPEKFEKLKKEILGAFKTTKDIDFDTLNKLDYLRAFVFETMRYFAAVPL